MSDEPEPSQPSEPTPTGRSRYEDFDLEVPQPTASRGSRTPTLTVAAVVLFFSGLLPLISVLAFRPSGDVAIVLAVLGVAELIGATLVFLLRPLGRPLGIVLGIVTGRSSPANGLVTIGLNGYVIYAMAVSGSSFRRG